MTQEALGILRSPQVPTRFFAAEMAMASARPGHDG